MSARLFFAILLTVTTSAVAQADRRWFGRRTQTTVNRAQPRNVVPPKSVTRPAITSKGLPSPAEMTKLYGPSILDR